MEVESSSPGLFGQAVGRRGRDASSAGVTVRLGLFPPASARGPELSDNVC